MQREPTKIRGPSHGGRRGHAAQTANKTDGESEREDEERSHGKTVSAVQTAVKCAGRRLALGRNAEFSRNGAPQSFGDSLAGLPHVFRDPTASTVSRKMLHGSTVELQRCSPGSLR